MKIIKKYTALEIKTEESKTSSFSHDLRVNLSHGNLSEIINKDVKTEFDTEDQAIIYAYEQNKWGTWVILPILRFDNYSERN